MAQRYFIYLKYDGTAYHGWQVQPNARSVQGEIQQALSVLFREETLIVGAGRTDTGVHAHMMVAHFDTDKDLDCILLTYKLNRLLPRDISIDSIAPVAADMHARFSAKWRTYHYYVHQRKDAFLRHYSCELFYDLDIDKMNEASALLPEYEDFASFCKSNTDVKTTLCNVAEARWIRDDDHRLHFVITANRFLRNMVRAIVGTLIDVGRGRITIEQFKDIIEGKSRSKAGDSMPGNALFLEKIVY